MTNRNASKILLVDTAFAAIPIYKYLVNSGFDVWVMGNRPDDVLAQKAGENWINQDYSKVSEVRSHIDHLGIDYLVPGCTDVSIDTCIALRGDSSFLDSECVNATISNKLSFRELCAKLRLPSPCAYKIDDFPMTGRYICKPVDSFSGRGVTIFDGSQYEEALAAYKVAKIESISSTAIIESYIDGQLFSYSAFVERNKVVSSFLVLEGSSATPFAVDTSYVVDTFPDKSLEILQTSIESVSKHLQLVDGLIHTQFILDNDTPMLVEMSRRCPGDLYPLLIEYSTGFEYAAKYASYFVNETYSTRSQGICNVIRHTVTSDNNVVLCELQFQGQQPVKAYYPLQTVGQAVFANQKSRLGILFCEYGSLPRMLYNFSRFVDRSAYVVL